MIESTRRIPVILLCAGYGTRMAAVTAGRPKPLLPVGGRPVLDWLLEQLADLPRRGEIHVISNRRHAPAFASWAARHPLTPTIHDDGSTTPEERLGAVGDLAWFIEGLAALPDRALVAAGDNVFRFDLAPVWTQMIEAPTSTTLALEERSTERLRRTGVLELSDGDRIQALHEKPEDPPSSWACPPFYMFHSGDLETVPRYLAQGGSPDEIGRFVAYLAATSDLRAIRVAGRRLDIGNPESWRAADEELSKNRPRMYEQGVRTSPRRRFKG